MTVIAEASSRAHCFSFGNYCDSLCAPHWLPSSDVLRHVHYTSGLPSGWLTLQDSRPHVLFGTILVKHLLDLISSFPQPVQFLRFDFGDAHRGRAIRIQGGGNQRVCNFQDVLKLFFKRPSSFCMHWRFSLSLIVKRRKAARLGCPFSF